MDTPYTMRLSQWETTDYRLNCLVFFLDIRYQQHCKWINVLNFSKRDSSHSSPNSHATSTRRQSNFSWRNRNRNRGVTLTHRRKLGSATVSTTKGSPTARTRGGYGHHGQPLLLDHIRETYNFAWNGGMFRLDDERDSINFGDLVVSPPPSGRLLVPQQLYFLFKSRRWKNLNFRRLSDKQ